jgi:hypothetical protein
MRALVPRARRHAVSKAIPATARRSSSSSSGHLPRRARVGQQRAEDLPAQPERGRLAEYLAGDLGVGARPRDRAGPEAAKESRMLESEGLVIRYPGLGYYVAERASG